MIDLENDPGAKKNSGGIEYRYLPRSGGYTIKSASIYSGNLGKRGVTSEEARFQNLKALLQGCESTRWPCLGQARRRQVYLYATFSYQLLSR